MILIPSILKLAGSGDHRTAQKFKKQIFLSIDVPPMMMGDGPKLALHVERRLAETLAELEK